VSLFIWRAKQPGALKPQPNPYPSRFQRWHYNLVFSLILFLFIVGAIRFYKPFYDPLQKGLFEGTAWIQSIFMTPFHETHAFFKETYIRMHLKEEYERLKKEHEKQQWLIQTLTLLQHENAVLRQNLKVTNSPIYEHQTVRVLSTPYDGIHHFFLIAAGEKNGLQKDQAVISPEGVVGRLEKVGSFISRILLLNDSSSRIPVITLESEQKAILSGDGSFMPTLVYIGDAKKIQKGEPVVTSGFGGIFPPGLPIGIVDDVSNGKLRVRPYAPLRDLEWVHILQFNSEEYLEELNSSLEGE